MLTSSLYKFIAQRPGMDPRNYDWQGYRQESRAVTRDRHEAETLLAAVERAGISDEALIEAARRSFSGRLTISADGRIDYCTGQYFPTEYRKAVAATCATALRAYWRDECCCDTFEKIKAQARRTFRQRGVREWFN